MPSAVDIEHARRLGNAEIFNRPPPPDRLKVMQSLMELPTDPEAVPAPQWEGSMHRSPVPTDRMAAILAVADYPRILVELASDPNSEVRDQAAAVAAFLRIEAVMPALGSILDSPIPPWPWKGWSPAGEKPSVLRSRSHKYVQAVAAWRVAVVGLAGFDRRELVPHLIPILFNPPDWFVAPRQLDLRHDGDEVHRAREAVYRMLVRSGGHAAWEALKKFEEQELMAAARVPMGHVHTDDDEVVAAVTLFFTSLHADNRVRSAALAAPVKVDQIAIRGERARARVVLSISHVFRASLRRQDGIWRVDYYWPLPNL